MKQKILQIPLIFLLILLFSSIVFAQPVGFNASVANNKNNIAFNSPDNLGQTQINFYSLWYSEYLKGVKVGCRNIKRYKTTLNGQPVIVSSSYSDMTISRMNSTLNLIDQTDYYETVDAKPIKFIQITKGGSSHDVTMEGVVKGNIIEIKSVSYGNTTNATVNIDKSVLFPYAVDKLYLKYPRQSFNYKTVLPELGGKVINVKSEYMDTSSTDLLNEKKDLNKFKVSADILQNLQSYEWRNDNGIIYKSKTSLLDAESILTTEDIAKSKENNKKKVDIITSSVIYTDKSIPSPRQVTDVTYIARLKQGDIKGIFVQDNRQRILNESLNQVTLEVKSYLPDYLMYRLPFTDPKFVQFLKDNNYIQSKNPTIRALANKIIGNEKNAFKAAKMLEKWVFKNIKNKNYDVGLATATETLETLNGDCTEHAILLASLYRSVGIPSRIVVGLIYMPVAGINKGVFGYHMWTEAFVGDWLDFDATIANDTVVDSTHIALSKSTMNNPQSAGEISFSAVNIIGNLELQILNYSSKYSGMIDINNQASMNALSFNISSMAEKNLGNESIPLKNINLEKFQDSKIGIEKYNITGLPNVSPVLESCEGYFTQGMGIYATGEPEKSIPYFQKVANLLPETDAKRHYDLGVRLFGLMMFNLGKEQFDKAIDLKDKLWSKKAQDFLNNNYPKGEFSKDAEKYNMIGFSFSNFTNNHPADLLMYEKALTDSPNFESALYNVANIYQQQGDYDKAIEDYQKVLRVNPKNSLVYAGLAQTYEQMGNIDNAIKYCENAINLANKSEINFINDLKFKQTSLKAKKMLDKNKNDLNAYMLIGQVALNCDKYESAKDAFMKVLSVNAKIDKAHTGLARALLKMGKPIDAEFEFKKALSYNFNDKDAFVGLGIINKRRLDFVNSIQYFSKALQLSPKNNDINMEIADTYFEKGDYDKAINQYLKINNAIAMYKVGLTYNKKKNISQAKTYYEKSINLNPLDARPYKDLGKIYFEMHDNKNAREYLEKSIALDTNYADAYYYLGLLDEQEGNIVSAINNLAYAYTVNPSSIGTYNKIRSIYESLNQVNKFNLTPPKYVPTRAEKDYLIKLFYNMSINTKNLLEKTDKLLATEGGLFYTNGDYVDKTVKINVLNDYLIKLKNLYKLLLGLKAPTSMQNLQNAYLNFLWEAANFNYQQIHYLKNDALIENSDDPETVKFKEDFNNKSKQLSEKTATFFSLVKKILNNWDAVSIDEIIISSGFDIKKQELLEQKESELKEKSDKFLAEQKEKKENEKTGENQNLSGEENNKSEDVKQETPENKPTEDTKKVNDNN